jgi:pSer/pThr/pTyr-binding forkhead associated (FHA) protein/RNA polymerase subunit RPABC4/transcription elongation factor Spt4
MNFEIGIACGECDTFSPMGTAACPVCGNDLSLISEGETTSGADSGTSSTTDSRAQQPVAHEPQTTQLSEEELMDQARHYVCRECSMGVPSGHKFCGTCGAAVPPEIVEMQTKYFGTLQSPGRARLILIRGDSDVDGLSYLLQGTEHVAGRKEGQILFPEDHWMSPRHANFFYEDDKLVVRDEGSLNGVYYRVREPVPIEFDDQFLCGEQLFRLEATPPDSAGPGPDQTYFYSSPHRSSTYRIAQILKGGLGGAVYSARSNTMTIGREECDISFPSDVYMSGRHAQVEMLGDGTFKLVDSDSKNGTYLRVKQSQVLQHGDYIFLGKQLLRVEMTG